MFKVLGEYRPAVYDENTIGRELLAFTRNLGLIPVQRYGNKAFTVEEQDTAWDHGQNPYAEADVRKPDNQASPRSDVGRWHQDGHSVDIRGHRQPMCLVLWASETPTELKCSDGTVFQPNPFEVVLICNDKTRHRTPKVLGGNRWWFRQAVQTPEWFKERT